MAIQNQQQPEQTDENYKDNVDRDPAEVDEDQLDEAVEETFPASDPISP